MINSYIVTIFPNKTQPGNFALSIHATCPTTAQQKACAAATEAGHDLSSAKITCRLELYNTGAN